jgi:Domain of unknown function (DUF4386)
MDSNRRIAVSTGVLFIIATVAALVAAALRPGMTATDYLAKLSGTSNQVTGAALFYLIAAFTSAGIAILLYPVLKKWNAGLALGSVVLRAMEAVMYVAAVVSLLSLLTVSKQFANAGAADRTSLQAVGNALLSLNEHATLAGVFAFSLGALMYYYVFFQSRLIPRWLSGWGVAASLLMMVACLLSLFSDSPVTGYTLLILPIAVQEMVLAVWLMVKGFSSAPLQSITASTSRVAASEPNWNAATTSGETTHEYAG